MNERDDTTRTQRPASLTRVLVPTDFSDGAAKAISRAARLPLVERGHVTILHVLPDRLPQEARASAETIARGHLDRAMTMLREASASTGRDDIRADSVLVRGPTFLEICRHASSLAAELIVMGRHGRRPLKDMLIGSTAERTIRAAELPVLVVSRKARQGYGRPLIAVDLEDSSRSVVAAGLRIVGRDVTTANLIHAFNVPFESFVSGASPGGLTELRREYRHNAASGVARLKTSLEGLGVHFQTNIVRGDPRSVILSEAVRHRADLVVVGTHGRSGVAHAMLGSVAEWVIRAAACDVLVVRP